MTASSPPPRDDGDSDHQDEPPVHPVPQLQGPFEESMMEAMTDGPELVDTLDAFERRAMLLENKEYERVCSGRWKQKPGEKFHPLWKLSAQLSFGIHLLAQGLAKSEDDVMIILQNHVDDIDGFLERTAEDFDLSYSDISDRLKHLQLPLEHLDVFDKMLEDKRFRNTLVTGNERIEHIAIRTAEALKDALKDCKKGIDATASLGMYLESIRGVWTTDSEDFEAVYVAMVGNCEGWNIAFRDLIRKGDRLTSTLAKITAAVDEIQRRCGIVSRRGLGVDMEPTPVETISQRQKDRKSMRRSYQGFPVDDAMANGPQKALPSAPNPFDTGRQVAREQLRQHTDANRSHASPDKHRHRQSREPLSANHGKRTPAERHKLMKKPSAMLAMKDKRSSQSAHPSSRGQQSIPKLSAVTSSLTTISEISSKRSSLLERRIRSRQNLADATEAHTPPAESEPRDGSSTQHPHRSHSMTLKIFSGKFSSRSRSEKEPSSSKRRTHAMVTKVDDATSQDPNRSTEPEIEPSQQVSELPDNDITALPQSPPFRPTSKDGFIRSPRLRTVKKSLENMKRSDPDTRNGVSLHSHVATTSSQSALSPSKNRQNTLPAPDTSFLLSPSSPPLPIRSPKRASEGPISADTTTTQLLDSIIATTTANTTKKPTITSPRSFHAQKPSLATIASVSSSTSNHSPQLYGHPSIVPSPITSPLRYYTHPLSPSLEAPPPPPPGGRKMVEPDYVSARGFEGERTRPMPTRTQSQKHQPGMLSPSPSTSSQRSGNSMNRDAWKNMFARGAASATLSPSTSDSTLDTTAAVASTTSTHGLDIGESSSNTMSGKGKARTRSSAPVPPKRSSLGSPGFEDEGKWFKGMGVDGVWVSSVRTGADPGTDTNGD